VTRGFRGRGAGAGHAPGAEAPGWNYGKTAKAVSNATICHSIHHFFVILSDAPHRSLNRP
jgi:hypothetical protein